MKTAFKNGELKVLVDIIKSESKYDLSYNDYVAKKILEFYQDIMLRDEQSERE